MILIPSQVTFQNLLFFEMVFLRFSGLTYIFFQNFFVIFSDIFSEIFSETFSAIFSGIFSEVQQIFGIYSVSVITA